MKHVRAAQPLTMTSPMTPSTVIFPPTTATNTIIAKLCFKFMLKQLCVHCVFGAPKETTLIETVAMFVPKLASCSTEEGTSDLQDTSESHQS